MPMCWLVPVLGSPTRDFPQYCRKLLSPSHGHISTWFDENWKELDVLSRRSTPDFWAHAWPAWFGRWAWYVRDSGRTEQSPTKAIPHQIRNINNASPGWTTYSATLHTKNVICRISSGGEILSSAPHTSSVGVSTEANCGVISILSDNPRCVAAIDSGDVCKIIR